MSTDLRRRRSPTALLAVVVLIILGISAIAYWQLSSSDTANTNAATNTNTNTANANTTTGNENISGGEITYEDATDGFSLSYPEAWTRKRSASGSGENAVVNYVFGTATEGVTLAIVPKAMEGIVRESFSISEETPVTIGGVQASRASAATAKDGSPVTLLFLENRGSVFVLNGPAALVDSVGETFIFIE